MRHKPKSLALAAPRNAYKSVDILPDNLTRHPSQNRLPLDCLKSHDSNTGQALRQTITNWVSFPLETKTLITLRYKGSWGLWSGQLRSQTLEFIRKGRRPVGLFGYVSLVSSPPKCSIYKLTKASHTVQSSNTTAAGKQTIVEKYRNRIEIKIENWKNKQ